MLLMRLTSSRHMSSTFAFILRSDGEQSLVKGVEFDLRLRGRPSPASEALHGPLLRHIPSPISPTLQRDRGQGWEAGLAVGEEAAQALLVPGDAVAEAGEGHQAGAALPATVPGCSKAAVRGLDGEGEGGEEGGLTEGEPGAAEGVADEGEDEEAREEGRAPHL